MLMSVKQVLFRRFSSVLLPRDAMLARVYMLRRLRLSAAASPIILVFRHRWSLLNSDGFIPNRGAEYKGGQAVRKLGDF